MDYIIRQLNKDEFYMLNDFLYEAIYIPEGIKPLPKSVIDLPQIQKYICNFGSSKHDNVLAAEVNGNIVGAVWSGIIDDYGHIDDDTPSLAMSLYKEYRGNGIGTAMLQAFISLLKSKGYKRVSLSVQKANYAVRLYKKSGFKIFAENAEEYIMVKDL